MTCWVYNNLGYIHLERQASIIMTSTPIGKRRRTHLVRDEVKSAEIPDHWKIHHEIAFLGPEGTYGQQVSPSPLTITWLSFRLTLVIGS